ncbi:MAG: hypothetical protein ACPIOQ_71020, partial [Promethearchaeia archaeon]
MVHTPVLERKRDCSTMPNTLSPHTIARDAAQSACRRRRGEQQRRGPHCQRHFPPAGSLPWSDFVLTHVGSSRSAADMCQDPRKNVQDPGRFFGQNFENESRYSNKTIQ